MIPIHLCGEKKEEIITNGELVAKGLYRPSEKGNSGKTLWNIRE